MSAHQPVAGAATAQYTVIGKRFWLSAIIVCLLHENYELAFAIDLLVLFAYVQAWCLEEIEKDLHRTR